MRQRFSELFLSRGVNYCSEDIPFQTTLKYLGFEADADLTELGSFISEDFIESLDYIDHYGKPLLQTWNVLGERIDYVRISPEHARILQRLQDYGIIRKMVNHEKSILYHYVSGYIVSDSGIFCTFTLTAQTAYALEKYGESKLKDRYLKNFADLKNPWYGATFYSEIQGGSDLGANRTVATENSGRYLLNGSDKYFASNAGIADSAVVTARLEGSREGAKGISLFFVPAFKEDGTSNYLIRRLKNKLGTVAVPTGEVEFQDSEGYLLGSNFSGIHIAMEILTISRIDDAIAAIGIARKAMWEACRYTSRREAFGKKLIDHELMLKDLVEMESEIQASVVLSFLAAKAFEQASEILPPYTDKYNLARVLSSIAKNVASDCSAQVTRYSMEILGGIGFFEEFPLAKFHRDSIVTSIWEGTSNIQALEMLEAVVKKNAGSILKNYLRGTISEISDRKLSKHLLKDMELVFDKFSKHLGAGEGEFYSKSSLSEIGNLIALIHMYRIAQTGSDIFTKSVEVFHARHFHPDQYSREMVLKSRSIIEWML